MVLELILLGIGIIGFGLAAYWDLKTTEFPDWLPYFIIIASLVVNGIFSFLYNNFSILINSAFAGLLFLGFGLLLYYSKQWGDGDAWLFGALGFLFPFSLPIMDSIMPPQLIVVFNFFLVAFAYLIVYSLVVGFRSEGTYKKFKKELNGDAKGIVISIIIFFAASLTAISYLNASSTLSQSTLLILAGLPILFTGLLIFVKYGRFIEGNMFKKKIPVSKLRVGDVPAGERWRVLSKKEVASLKKRGGYIWIKEGVRFAPVFVITIILTFLYGNLFYFFAYL